MRFVIAGLGDGQVHVWHGCIHPADRTEPRPADLAVLSAGEHLRCERFTRAADRVRFAAAHAAARRLLAAYLGAAPTAIVMGRCRCCMCGSDQHGAPRISFPSTDIRCNLSRSGDHWLLAVTNGGSIGADIEVLRGLSIGELVAACLTAGEQRYLNARPENERLRLFYQCWTRKEAVLKACGVGLAGEMRELDVAPGQAGTARVRYRCPAGPEFWAVQNLSAGGAETDMWVAAIAWPAAAAGQVLLREAGECSGPR